MKIQREIVRKMPCVHEVGECYVDGDAWGEVHPMMVVHAFQPDAAEEKQFDVYLLVDVVTGKTVCVDDTLEEMDRLNPGHLHIETVLVLKNYVEYNE